MVIDWGLLTWWDDVADLQSTTLSLCGTALGWWRVLMAVLKIATKIKV